MEWRRDEDMPARKEMIKHLLTLLDRAFGDVQPPPQEGQPHLIPPDDEVAAPPGPVRDTPCPLRRAAMAKRLELRLYQQAPTLEAYRDITTLKQRLRQLKTETRQNGAR